LKLLVFTGEKLTLRVYSYIFEYRPLPLTSFSHPPSTSRPPDVTHVMDETRELSRSAFQSSNPTVQYIAIRNHCPNNTLN